MTASYTIDRVPNSEKPADTEVPSIYDVTYSAMFIALSVLLAISPILRNYNYELFNTWNFDRLEEAFLVVLILVRFTELMHRTRRIKLIDYLLFGFLIMFATVTMFNYTSKNFVLELFFTEAKLPFFCIAIALFGGKTLPEQLARRVSIFVMACFVFGLCAFLVAGSGERLNLLSESNYMAIAAFLVIVGFLSAHRIIPFSSQWFLCVTLLVAVIAVSQSRTAVAAFIAYVAFLMVQNLSILRASLIVMLAVVAYAIVDQYVLDVVFRGLGSARLTEIDRFIFLREYFSYIDRVGWGEFLLATNIGTYMSHDVYYMVWWVAVQSVGHGIEFGLAPFNLHSGYLRMLAAYGLIPTIGILVYVFALLRSRSWVLVLIVSLSLVSMSTLYLSPVVPFIILSLVIVPKKLQKHEVMVPHRQQLPALRYEESRLQEP